MTAEAVAANLVLLGVLAAAPAGEPAARAPARRVEVIQAAYQSSETGQAVHLVL